MEGEQRWETNNGNSLETRGHLHRLEHQVSSGQNCEFRIQNDNYDDYFDNCDDYFDLHLLEHQVCSDDNSVWTFVWNFSEGKRSRNLTTTILFTGPLLPLAVSSSGISAEFEEADNHRR